MEAAPQESRRGGQALQTRKSSLFAGTESAATQEGAGNPASSTSRFGEGPNETLRAGGQGKAQEPRQNPRAGRAFEGSLPQGAYFRNDDRNLDQTAQTRMVVGPSEVQTSVAGRRGIPVADQSARLDGARILGDLHATDSGRARFSSAQERVASAAHLAPLQRALARPRDGVRTSVRALEDARPHGQASRPDDPDPQTGFRKAPVFSQGETDDTASDPARTREDSSRRHHAEDCRWPGIGPAPHRRAQASPAAHLDSSEPDLTRASGYARSHFVVKTWPCRVR